MVAVPDLQSQLDTITSQTRSLVQADRLAITDAHIQDLMAANVEAGMLRVGGVAPAFALPDALTGKMVKSSDLLAVGPVILKFFRGRWCPYCMTELEVWQTLYADVREKGALLVAVSPQLPRQNDFTVQRHLLKFPVLSDKSAEVAAQFGITYSVPEAMQKHYRSILVNVPFINGDQSWRLPLPATFVIGQDGVLKFAEAHANHRVRPDPRDVLAVL